MVIAINSIVAPLFVPASRPDRFAKAQASGADAIIIDLEDAVADLDKDAARAALVANAKGLKGPVIVRVNAAGAPWHEADLDAVALLQPAALMLPKAENAGDIEILSNKIGNRVAIIPLVETAVGLSQLSLLLQAPCVVLVAFGSVDLALDLGCAEDRQALLVARSEIVWRSRAANLAAPLDGVTTKLEGTALVEEDARHAAMLGFGGKMAIHPRQIEPIMKAFYPDDAAIAWARKILAAPTSGEATVVDGEMIDFPVRERAQRILQKIGQTGRSGN